MGLAGLAVAALAFATFTGGGESDIPSQGFYPEAEQIEREAHLEGQARTYLGTAGTPATDATAEGSSDTGFLPVAGTCRRAEPGGRGRGPSALSSPAGAPRLIEARPVAVGQVGRTRIVTLVSPRQPVFGKTLE